MLEEHEPPFGFQSPANFGEGRGGVRDRTQGQSGYYRVETVSFKGQSPLRVERHPRDWERAGGAAVFDPVLQHILRIDRGQLCHSLRVIRQIQSSAEADFKRL